MVKNSLGKAPQAFFYAYSNGYIYLDTYGSRDEPNTDPHSILRISPNGAAEKLSIEFDGYLYVYGTGISVSDEYIYIAGTNKTLYAVHQNSMEAIPVVSWSGEVAVAEVQDAYLYIRTEAPTQENVPAKDIYYRIMLSEKILLGQTILDNTHVAHLENITLLPEDVFQKRSLGFDMTSDSGESLPKGEQISYYFWDGELLYGFPDFEHPGHNRGYTLYKNTLYYIDLFGGDTVLKIMQPSA